MQNTRKCDQLASISSSSDGGAKLTVLLPLRTYAGLDGVPREEVRSGVLPLLDLAAEGEGEGLTAAGAGTFESAALATLGLSLTAAPGVSEDSGCPLLRCLSSLVPTPESTTGVACVSVQEPAVAAGSLVAAAATLPACGSAAGGVCEMVVAVPVENVGGSVAALVAEKVGTSEVAAVFAGLVAAPAPEALSGPLADRDEPPAAAGVAVAGFSLSKKSMKDSSIPAVVRDEIDASLLFFASALLSSSL
mmetsp:Transcript_45705/g.71614  ORF Transcript_45705/g.71614 Transcript_45705/m.71614 type:complete len:248 (+) Transcript_45705:342-1085(+)